VSIIQELTKKYGKTQFIFEDSVDFESPGNEVKKLQPVEIRVGHDRNNRALIQTVYQGVNQGGLAGAHVTGEQDKALVVDDAVFQYSQSLPVLLPQPEKLRIRTYLKRLFS
jgi:hypothetical protein